MSDYEGFEPTTSVRDLEVLTGLAERQQKLEAEIEAKEEELKELQKQHREISWKHIPETMDALKMRKFELANGFTVSISEKLRVSVPAKNRADAYQWVEENDGQALVKRTMVIPFSKEQEKLARKFKRDCEQRKVKLPMEETKTIASPTLNKFLTDKLAEGVDVPLDLFGAFRQRIAKIQNK